MAIKNISITIILIFALAIPINLGLADDSDLDRESLLIEDLPMVTTPSRVAQPILESPSTITVLTKEDIRRYGINSLSDILRNVPGVDVMTVSPTDRNISMRGFNQLMAGKILPLVDGRQVYVAFYGITKWEQLPVSIDDIERIEIIRGPGSALYGADAFDGIVNIITDSGLASAGTKLSANLDQYGSYSSAISHGGRISKLSYKGSAKWSMLNEWDENQSKAGESKGLSGYLQYPINNNSSVSLSGNFVDEWGDALVFSASDPAKHESEVGNLKVDYMDSNLKFSSSWTRIYGKAKSDESLSHKPETGIFQNNKELSLYPINSDSVNTDLQHTFRLPNKNVITWGLNQRMNFLESKMLDGPHTQSIWSGYAQSQLQLLRPLILTTGLRYDKHPLTGRNFSPRCSLVYSPLAGHAFRISAGRAYRNPSFLYSYLKASYYITMPMLSKPVKVEALGNKVLSPEWITSYEMGYQGIMRNGLRGSVEIFTNKVYGLIDLRTVETYPAGSLFSGSPGGIIPSRISFFNINDANVHGGEISAELPVTNWLSAYTNYSYQLVTNSKTKKRIRTAPENKLNAGLTVKPIRGSVTSLFLNYVDDTIWDSIKVGSYTLLNLTSSFRLSNNKMELGLKLYNLLDSNHKEHPYGIKIGRSIILSLMYRI